MDPILIVGAGPVGLTMAAELARYGIPIRLIDQAPHPTTTSKALVVWARTLELLERTGCVPAFLDAGLKAHAITMHSGSNVLGHTVFDEIDSAYNYALMVPQSDTERLLAEHLARQGVTVERETTLTGFEAGPDAVEARLHHADGRDEVVRTPYLLGCDGAHSAVRHGLDLDFKGEAQDDDWLLADVRLDGPAAPPPDEMALFLDHDGLLAVFPMPGGRARVIASLGRAQPGHQPDPTLDQVQALIDARTGGFRASDPVWLSHFRINERKVADYRHGRVVLAGDAAHIHSPAGGQGMNTGMQDAMNLAWKLAMVLDGDAAPALLDSYSPERSAVGTMVVHNASRLTAMGTIEGATAQAARNLALKAFLGFHMVRRKLALTMSETEIAYPHSPLTRGTSAGARVPPADYAGPPPGAGGHPRFVLYAPDDAQAAGLAARFPTLLEAGVRPSEDLRIVRPDGYVGFRSARADWDGAEAYLQELAPH